MPWHLTVNCFVFFFVYLTILTLGNVSCLKQNLSVCLFGSGNPVLTNDDECFLSKTDWWTNAKTIFFLSLQILKTKFHFVGPHWMKQKNWTMLMNSSCYDWISEVFTRNLCEKIFLTICNWKEGLFVSAVIQKWRHSISDPLPNPTFLYMC